MSEEEQPKPEEPKQDEYGDGVTKNEKGEKMWVFGTLNKKQKQEDNADT